MASKRVGETRVNDSYEYGKDKMVNTPFLDPTPLADLILTEQWSETIASYTDMVLIFWENQYGDVAVVKECHFVESIRKDLQSFQPGEETRVKHLME